MLLYFHCISGAPELWMWGAIASSCCLIDWLILWNGGMVLCWDIRRRPADYYLQRWGTVLPGVCLSVCLSVCVEQSRVKTTDWVFIKMSTRDVFVDKEEPFNFSKSSTSGSGCRIYFKDSATLQDGEFSPQFGKILRKNWCEIFTKMSSRLQMYHWARKSLLNFGNSRDPDWIPRGGGGGLHSLSAFVLQLSLCLWGLSRFPYA